MVGPSIYEKCKTSTLPRDRDFVLKVLFHKDLNDFIQQDLSKTFQFEVSIHFGPCRSPDSVGVWEFINRYGKRVKKTYMFHMSSDKFQEKRPYIRVVLHQN